jgi:NADPH:quinone reductase-like Zn-dependent oxidoreductase
VLVKVMAAPINPSDLASFKGQYSQQKKFPAIMGFEGSGVVVESGGGLMGWGLVGKKVAIGAPGQHQGTYTQYMIAKS